MNQILGMDKPYLTKIEGATMGFPPPKWALQNSNLLTFKARHTKFSE